MIQPNQIPTNAQNSNIISKQPKSIQTLPDIISLKESNKLSRQKQDCFISKCFRITRIACSIFVNITNTGL